METGPGSMTKPDNTSLDTNLSYDYIKTKNWVTISSLRSRYLMVERVHGSTCVRDRAHETHLNCLRSFLISADSASRSEFGYDKTDPCLVKRSLSKLESGGEK